MSTQTAEYSAVFGTEFRQNLYSDSHFRGFQIFQFVNAPMFVHTHIKQQTEIFCPYSLA